MDISSLISFKYIVVRSVSLIITTGIISSFVVKALASDSFSTSLHGSEKLNQDSFAYYSGHHTLDTGIRSKEAVENIFWPDRSYQRRDPEMSRWPGDSDAGDADSHAVFRHQGQSGLVPVPLSGLTGQRDSLLYHSDQAHEIKPGMTLLHEHQISVPVFEIEAEIQPGLAKEVGFQIRSAEQGAVAVIGYDAGAESIYIDSHHTSHDFVRFFPAKHYARVKLDAGVLKLRIRVDMSSVTVFSGVSQVVLTEQIFPQLSDTGMKLFSHGGVSVLKKISIWSIHSVWEHSHLIF
ncbi:Levanase precursor [Vibrio aerogenes CECT 7868]|uniref:Levanase n=1 Tax=Vibrio aerogenes CECT 7868 TaxID=1216006 RepID=A0A1M5ZAB2_9VIBR|nr:GH32 C-terminal domain-containing protein [Vibrio aerogenes]SHI21164.1 Levanase precursor [Vibrio aerogenes CECT 7868]